MKLDLVHELLDADQPVTEAERQAAQAAISGEHDLAVDLDEEHMKKHNPKLYAKCRNWD